MREKVREPLLHRSRLSQLRLGWRQSILLRRHNSEAHHQSILRSKSTHTHGMLPVRDNEPSYFMRLPEVCASLDLSTHNENGRAKLASRWLRAGNALWEFKKNCFIVEHGFQQSFVNPCVFHLYWEETYYCPTDFFLKIGILYRCKEGCTQLNIRRSVSLVTFQN